MKIQSKHRQVVDLIGRDIVNSAPAAIGEDIRPGEIEQQLSVSRSVIREAVRVLEDKGLLASRTNSGTRVQPVAGWNLLDPDVARWIHGSPGHAELKVHAKEFADALRTIAPALAGNPYLQQAFNALVPLFATFEQPGDDGA